jgi:hypothetical protein
MKLYSLRGVKMPLEYKESFKAVNDKPISSEWVEVFCSDWNKEHWSFYAYIDKDNYEQDIEDINTLLQKLNFRDGDVYIELIDHSSDLEGFYHYLYKLGQYTQSEVLNPEYWEILEEKGDTHFKYFSELNGGTHIDDIRNAEYIEYESWDNLLETLYPDLAKALDDSNGWGCFDSEHFFNCQNFHEIEGVIVEEVC